MKAHKTVTCPHCSKEGSSNVMKTWHFDRCKDGPNLRPARRPKVAKEDITIEDQKMAKHTTIRHPITGIDHVFQIFPKIAIVNYYVILDDRSVHPTPYTILTNAIIAFNYLNIKKCNAKKYK